MPIKNTYEAKIRTEEELDAALKKLKAALKRCEDLYEVLKGNNRARRMGALAGSHACATACNLVEWVLGNPACDFEKHVLSEDIPSDEEIGFYRAKHATSKVKPHELSKEKMTITPIEIHEREERDPTRLYVYEAHDADYTITVYLFYSNKSRTWGLHVSASDGVKSRVSHESLESLVGRFWDFAQYHPYQYIVVEEALNQLLDKFADEVDFSTVPLEEREAIQQHDPEFYKRLVDNAKHRDSP